MGLNFKKNRVYLKGESSHNAFTFNCTLKQLTSVNKAFLESLGFKVNDGNTASK